MAIKRSIDTGLWNDPLVLDEFNNEDKFFWLYCLTNPHNNICGTAIISKKTIAREMGVDISVIENVIDRFANKYKRIQYNEENNEILILNWGKYNWTSSMKIEKALTKELKGIKTKNFQDIIKQQTLELQKKRKEKFLSTEKSKEVYNKYKGHCAYCGTKLNENNYTQDHITPRAKKGNNSIQNLYPCCSHCNTLKNDKTLDILRDLLKAEGKIKDKFYFEGGNQQ